jgi:hypothetical protein
MLRRWITAFNGTARTLLARRQAQVLLLEAEPCPEHGDRCARILAGDFIIDHAACYEADPAARAEALLEKLLTRLQAV